MEDKNQEALQYLSLIEHDPEEKLVCMIKKHPFGLLPIYFTGTLVGLSLVVIGIFFISSLDTVTVNSDTTLIRTATYIITTILCLLTAALTWLAAFIYRHNTILVTSDKVVQIVYKNIVDRKVSQLSLGDLQDVTVDQKGIFARFFGYGQLVIETAGEQNNFIFGYTPFPYKCASEIVGAREASIKKYGN